MDWPSKLDHVPSGWSSMIKLQCQMECNNWWAGYSLYPVVWVKSVRIIPWPHSPRLCWWRSNNHIGMTQTYSCHIKTLKRDERNECSLFAGDTIVNGGHIAPTTFIRWDENVEIGLCTCTRRVFEQGCLDGTNSRKVMFQMTTAT